MAIHVVPDEAREKAPPKVVPAATMKGAAGQLRAFVERLERLEDDRAALAADMKEVFAEAKSLGFDVKALRAVLRMRNQDEKDRLEHEAIVSTYLHALGMIPALI